MSPTPDRLPWYRWFPSDFLGETYGWELVARGIYRELLDLQWQQGTLPADPKKLRELARAKPREWRIAWPQISEKFLEVNGGRQHMGLAKLRAESERKHSAQK